MIQSIDLFFPALSFILLSFFSVFPTYLFIIHSSFNDHGWYLVREIFLFIPQKHKKFITLASQSNNCTICLQEKVRGKATISHQIHMCALCVCIHQP